MKKLIIIGAILASTALIVALAHEGASTQEITIHKKSAVMKIKIKIPKNITDPIEYDVRDEDNYPGDEISEENFKKAHPNAEVIGTIYKYTENPNCTVYCAGGNCWRFCW